jgi:DNA-binding CsgD family transcriptional regulator
MDAVDDEVRDALPEPQRHALDVVLLLQSPGKTPVDQRAISAAVVSTLGTLAQRGPLLMAVDDLQWLDPASASALAFAIRRVQDRDQIAVLATVRSGEPRQGTHDLLEELASRGARRLEPGPLDTSALGRILAQRLGSELPINVLRKIREVSRGNAFFALEIARAIFEEGLSEEHGAAQLRVPADLQQTLRRRLSWLSPSARQTLLLASAFAHPTVASISTASVDAHAGIEEAVAAGIVGTEGDFVRFTHPLFASVVYADATTEERRSVHKKLAEIARDPEEHARHVAEAHNDPDAAIADVVEEGARYARMRGATASSAELFGLAAELTPPATNSSYADRRRMEEAETLFLAGEEQRASELMVPIVERSQPGPARAQALWRLARVLFYIDVSEAASALLEALEEHGVDDRLRSRILTQLANALFFIGALQEAQRNAADAIELAESSADPSTLAEALTILAWTRSAIGLGFSLELLERAVGLENDIETFIVADRPSYALAVTLFVADELERSRAIYERLLVLSYERGDDHSAGNIHVDLGHLEYWSGNLDAATKHLSEPTTRAVREWSMVGAVWALVQGCLGDVEAARVRAQGALAAAERSGNFWDRLDCYQALGFIELSVGDHEAAVACLEPAWALHQQAGVREPTYRFPADLAESLIAVGRADEAEPIVTWLAERGDELAHGWAIGAAARCRGLLLAAHGSLPPALAELGRAAEAHRLIGIPLELARTLLTRGRIARRAKGKREAREALEDAMEIFERLPAPLWVDKARSELARISGRRPSSGRLTPTEARVARLAAVGRTNQEIADTLFMSVRTVESHLARTYAKLGVRSRTELAGALDAAPIPP